MFSSVKEQWPVHSESSLTRLLSLAIICNSSKQMAWNLLQIRSHRKMIIGLENLSIHSCVGSIGRETESRKTTLFIGSCYLGLLQIFKVNAGSILLLSLEELPLP